MVLVERRGNRASNTLTGAAGLYNGRSVSRQNQPRFPILFRYGANAPPPSFRLHPIGPCWVLWLKELGGANAPSCPMPVCLQFGAEREGKMGARVEN